MNTIPVSSEVLEKSRKFHSLALQKISKVGQNEIAKLISTSDSTLSRFVSADLERACQILAASGLKIVPIEMRCYDHETIEAIFTLAKKNLQRAESADQLTFED